MDRIASVARMTSETKIEMTLNIDGSGQAEIDTGIGFFDHMLNSFAKHGFFDLKCKVVGDLYVDCHHTIEDTGIVLGECIKKAIGDKKGMTRYGSCILPMDESLILCALDLSGRPYFVTDMEFRAERVGGYDTEMVKEFFYAISYAAGMNLHIRQISGSNAHHIIEGAYKSFAKALDQATKMEPRIHDVLSTKGSL
ncbi:MAG: imidazoleglycerol-phosphate dehydratase HisB [Lachnospiraceae bacterium]|nr:imidazoleglycerol-phosphate dehydratase HisB [Lachnospiraceae bacterium]